MMSSDWKPALNDVLMDRHGLWRLTEIVPDYNGPVYVLVRHGVRAIYDADNLRDRFSPAPALSTPNVGDIFIHPPTQQLWQVVARGTNEGDTHRLQAIGVLQSPGPQGTRWAVTSAFLYTEFEEKQAITASERALSVAEAAAGVGGPARLDEWVQQRIAGRHGPAMKLTLQERNEYWDVRVTPVQPHGWSMVDGDWFERVSARVQGVADYLQRSDAEPDWKAEVKRVLAKYNDLAASTCDEAWQQARCLSIAEGRPGWEQPTPNDSEAMRAVRALRQQYEDERQVAGVLAKEIAELRHLAATNALPRADGDRIVASWMKRTPPEGVTVQAWQGTVLHIAEQLTTGAAMDGRLQTHLADAWAFLEIYEGTRRKLIRQGK